MSAPPTATLAQLQARMQAHVLTGDAAVLTDVDASASGAGGLSAERRLGLYRHAYRARLNETLRDSFGHTLMYLGDAWFDQLAGDFMAQHPSQHRNLRWYGEGWPDWLATTLHDGAPFGEHPEVAELARLDWALRRAFDAAHAPALTWRDLAAMAPEDWVGAVLRPQPSVALLHLQCNTLNLWHALDQDEAVPPAECLAAPVSVLVWRVDERPHFRSVSASEGLALQQIMQGDTFAAICLAHAQAHPDDDAATTAATTGAWLRRWLDEGLLDAGALTAPAA
jgi:hypothetical protein